MSTSFYGQRANKEAIHLDIEDPNFLNMSCANARAFLSFLGMVPGEGPDGEATVPEARRAIMKARATFDRHVGDFTRKSSDTKRPGMCRVFEIGIDEDYLARRLDSFEGFLNAVIAQGATTIYWG